MAGAAWLRVAFLDTDCEEGEPFVLWKDPDNAEEGSDLAWGPFASAPAVAAAAGLGHACSVTVRDKSRGARIVGLVALHKSVLAVDLPAVAGAAVAEAAAERLADSALRALGPPGARLSRWAAAQLGANHAGRAADSTLDPAARRSLLASALAGHAARLRAALVAPPPAGGMPVPGEAAWTRVLEAALGPVASLAPSLLPVGTEGEADAALARVCAAAGGTPGVVAPAACAVVGGHIVRRLGPWPLVRVLAATLADAGDLPRHADMPLCARSTVHPCFAAITVDGAALAPLRSLAAGGASDLRPCHAVCAGRGLAAVCVLLRGGTRRQSGPGAGAGEDHDEEARECVRRTAECAEREVESAAWLEAATLAAASAPSQPGTADLVDHGGRLRARLAFGALTPPLPAADAEAVRRAAAGRAGVAEEAGAEGLAAALGLAWDEAATRDSAAAAAAAAAAATGGQSPVLSRAASLVVNAARSLPPPSSLVRARPLDNEQAVAAALQIGAAVAEAVATLGLGADSIDDREAGMGPDVGPDMGPGGTAAEGESDRWWKVHGPARAGIPRMRAPRICTVSVRVGGRRVGVAVAEDGAITVADE